MHRASLRHRAFDPWPRAAQPWTTQDADAMWSGKTSAYLLKFQFTRNYGCASKFKLSRSFDRPASATGT